MSKRKFAGVSIAHRNANENEVIITAATPTTTSTTPLTTASTAAASMTNNAMNSLDQQSPISLFSTPKLEIVGQQQLSTKLLTTPLPVMPALLPITTTISTITTTPTISMSFPVAASITTTTTSPSVINIISPSSTNQSPVVINEIIDITTETPLSIMKERKRRMRIDDDDESPTFNPMSRGTRRGRGRGGRGSRGRGRLRTAQQQQRSSSIISSPDKSRDGGSSSCGVFTTPRLLFKESSSSLQVFEEDTRMSANDTFTTPMRYVGGAKS